MQTKSDRGDFSHGSIPGNILRLAVPITIAELIHVLYNVVDRMYIGHIPGTGTAALTGIGISLPLITLITAFAGLCGTGGAPLCSIARGKGRDSEAQAITETAFTLLLVFAAVLTGVLFFARKPLLCLMGADAETLPYAMEYFTIYLFGTVFVLINLGMNPFINAQGFSKVGMCTVLIGAVLNILLDPLFIFTFNLGVRGAAYATVISQFFGSVWVVLFLTGRRVTLPLRRLRLNWTYSLQILQLGATGFAFKITNSITQPVTGLTGGTQPVMGYNYGAKLYRRVRQSIGFMLLSTLGYTLAAWVLLMRFPEMLVRIFTPDPKLIEFCVPCLRVYFGVFFMMSFQMTGQNTYIGLNRPKLAVFFSLLRKIILIAPLTVLLPYTRLGVMGVFYAELISQLVGASACFLTMVFTIWRKMPQADQRMDAAV